MSRGNLAEQLANSIESWIRQDRLEEGTSLPERMLATRFRVSRSPVREALQILGDRGVIVARAEGGYAVASSASSAQALVLPPALLDEPAYLRIAEDRLSGQLADKVTETDLMRRYELTRGQVGDVLRRIEREGWIEPLPGQGWHFLPMLTSGAAYDQGYRLRILLEPAAILEPTFKLDRDALLKCQVEQKALVDGAAEWASPAQLFDANMRLHEAIAQCSGNVFIVDSLRRLNHLRRLMEYRKAVDRDATARRSKEHLTLIELLLCGQREAAADFMRLHLRDAAREKAEASRAPQATSRVSCS